MDKRKEIERRIELKRQLINLQENEIQQLQKELDEINNGQDKNGKT